MKMMEPFGCVGCIVLCDDVHVIKVGAPHPCFGVREGKSPID